MAPPLVPTPRNLPGRRLPVARLHDRQAELALIVEKDAVNPSWSSKVCKIMASQAVLDGFGGPAKHYPEDPENPNMEYVGFPGIIATVLGTYPLCGYFVDPNHSQRVHLLPISGLWFQTPCQV